MSYWFICFVSYFCLLFYADFLTAIFESSWLFLSVCLFVEKDLGRNGGLYPCTFQISSMPKVIFYVYSPLYFAVSVEAIYGGGHGRYTLIFSWVYMPYIVEVTAGLMKMMMMFKRAFPLAVCLAIYWLCFPLLLFNFLVFLLLGDIKMPWHTQTSRCGRLQVTLTSPHYKYHDTPRVKQSRGTADIRLCLSTQFKIQ